MMRYRIVIYVTLCGAVILGRGHLPLLAQEDDKAVSRMLLTTEDIADVRNVFRTLKLTFDKKTMVRIFGPDADGTITTVNVDIERRRVKIERFEIWYETTAKTKSEPFRLIATDADFKKLADNIKWIEVN